MKHRAHTEWIIVVIGLGLLSCGGCWRDGVIGGEEGGVPPFGEADIPLGPRIEDGRPVQGVALSNVQFGYDSFQVAPGETHKVEAAASYLRRNPGTRVVLEGHCDERGSRDYNMSLGEHRSLSVRAYLVGLGVDGTRVHTRSYGEELPVDPAHHESAWSRNRRVEFKLYR